MCVCKGMQRRVVIGVAFLFQAEGVIRGAQETRGLGEGYKRQAVRMSNDDEQR